jgi:LPS O-antigen subunit length determinant protein (WzzB/FepE family)
MIPDLEAEQKRILEKVIPAKEAAIKKLESMIIPKLQSKIDELKVSMKPPYLTPTKVIGGIKTHDHPIKPKKKLVLIVSLITGLMLGVFLALFREFLNKAPEERP